MKYDTYNNKECVALKNKKTKTKESKNFPKLGRKTHSEA